jgi:hypothetical protein
VTDGETYWPEAHPPSDAVFALVIVGHTPDSLSFSLPAWAEVVVFIEEMGE